MTLRILKAGIQTTLQGAPFEGHRHIGMPAAGAADALSLALANKLVGNEPNSAALEIAFGGACFLCEASSAIAVTGANCDVKVDAVPNARHKCLEIEKGQTVSISPVNAGCRVYLAVRGGFQSDRILGSQSTCLPAKLGGYQGRALVQDDILHIANSNNQINADEVTPKEFVPNIGDSCILRVTEGPEFERLSINSQNELLETRWTVGQRMNRMGMMLNGPKLESADGAKMESAPVFPGTVQCPPDGSPFLLGPDAQTTGGYPRVAQVIRADRHLVGQLRPGSHVQLVRTTSNQATRIYREKLAQLKPWLGEFQLW